MADISRNIKQARLQQGMNQTDLAEKIGVTRQTISSWERGLSFPDIHMLMKLSEILNIEISEKRKRITSEPISPKFILASIIIYTILLIWGGGFFAVPIFKGIVGGGVQEEFIFVLYWGLILLVGYISGCVCLIAEYICDSKNDLSFGSQERE